jgi:hypothetical protein
MTDSPFDAEAPYTTTLKGGAGFEAPWIVVRSRNVDGLKRDVSALDDQAFSVVQGAAHKFRTAQPPAADVQAAQTLANAGVVAQADVNAQYAVDAASGGPGAFNDPGLNQPASTPPWQAQQNPSGPSCKHGAKQFKSGVSKKNGKEWKAWDCPAPYGTPDRCEREFVR